MSRCPHQPFVRGSGSLISCLARFVTVTSPSSSTNFTDRISRKRASAPELGSLGRFEN
jgi:hypothetical protein